MGVFRQRASDDRQSARPYGTQRAITASARKLNKPQIENLATDKSAAFRKWQAEAWAGYNAVGEIHSGFGVVASTLSRIRVYGAAIISSSEVPTPLGDSTKELVDIDVAKKIESLMRELTAHDFASLVRAFALNMSVAGECYLIQIPGQDKDAPPEWCIKSLDEVKVESDKMILVPRSDQSSGGPFTRIIGTRQRTEEHPEGEWNVAIGRIWRQHPRYSEEPDSSMLAIADPIEQLLLVQRVIRSNSRARLNRGILYIPEEISAVPLGGVAGEQYDENGLPVQESSNAGPNLLDDLIRSAMDPIDDESSAASVVPLLLTGPADAGGAIKFITMDQQADQYLLQQGDKALERILQGIDVPKEVVTGLANVKYSNAIAIDEDFWKSNIEPLALVFVDALTDIYLRPSLIASGVDPSLAERICVWYDPSEIVTRPNRADEATEGYDKSLLSSEAWRREHGFSELDAPDEAELARQLVLKTGNVPDDVTSSLLQLLLPKILGEEREKNLAEQEVAQPSSVTDLLGRSGGEQTEGDPKNV